MRSEPSETKRGEKELRSKKVHIYNFGLLHMIRLVFLYFIGEYPHSSSLRAS